MCTHNALWHKAILTYIDQPIEEGSCQPTLNQVSYAIDSPAASRLGLRNSLVFEGVLWISEQVP